MLTSNDSYDFPIVARIIGSQHESTEGVAVGATTAMDYENAADSTENDAETVTK